MAQEETGKKLKPLTFWVSPDEPCYGLFEGPQKLPMPDGSTQRRWLQAVRVVRGDRIAFYETDFGPAEDFEEIATQQLIISEGTETVAQCQTEAERSRHDHYWRKRQEEMLAASTLKEDHLRQLEQLYLIKANRSHFGPGASVQRVAYPSQAATRKLKETIDARRGYKQF